MALNTGEWSDASPRYFTGEGRTWVTPKTEWDSELVWMPWRTVNSLPMLETEFKFPARLAPSLVTILIELVAFVKYSAKSILQLTL